MASAICALSDRLRPLMGGEPDDAQCSIPLRIVQVVLTHSHRTIRPRTHADRVFWLTCVAVIIRYTFVTGRFLAVFHVSMRKRDVDHIYCTHCIINTLRHRAPRRCR